MNKLEEIKMNEDIENDTEKLSAIDSLVDKITDVLDGHPTDDILCALANTIAMIGLQQGENPLKVILYTGKVIAGSYADNSPSNNDSVH